MNDFRSLSRFRCTIVCLKSCWLMLASNKAMFLFPFFSLIASASLLLAFIQVGHFNKLFSIGRNVNADDVSGVELLVGLLLFYLAINFIAAFIRTLQIMYLDVIIKNDKVCLSQYCISGIKKIWPVFLWSLLNSLLFNFFRVSYFRILCGAQYKYLQIVEFVSLPVIALHDGPFYKKIKEAVRSINNDYVFVRISVTVFSGIFALPLLIIFVALCYTLQVFVTGVHHLPHDLIPVAFVSLLSLWVILSLSYSFLDCIMRTVIYQYFMSGTCLRYFDSEFLESLCRRRTDVNSDARE